MIGSGMTQSSVAVVLFGLAVLTSPLPQGRGLSAGTDERRQADLAAIEKIRQQEIAATLSRDPVALHEQLGLIPERDHQRQPLSTIDGPELRNRANAEQECRL